jgi:hypothetical protein
MWIKADTQRMSRLSDRRDEAITEVHGEVPCKVDFEGHTPIHAAFQVTPGKQGMLDKSPEFGSNALQTGARRNCLNDGEEWVGYE